MLSDNQDLLIAKLKAVYAGFHQFCDTIGLNGEDILQTINFGALHHDCYLTIEHIKPDEGYILEIKLIFMELWQC
jgi:hypothetical protein